MHSARRGHTIKMSCQPRVAPGIVGVQHDEHVLPGSSPGGKRKKQGDAIAGKVRVAVDRVEEQEKD